jgi:hypothetical protein
MRTAEDILYSEVGWFYFGTGEELVQILDLAYEKRPVGSGGLPDGLKEPDDNDESAYYFCRSRVLVLDEDHNFRVDELLMVYGEKALMESGEGPQAMPDDYAWSDRGYSVDLTKDLEPPVLNALLENIKQQSEELIKNVAFKEDPEEYIRTIKNKDLLEAFLPHWEKNKEFWV